MKFSPRIYGSNAAVPGSGDVLIETLSALQTKSFLLANTFLDYSVTISPHKSLNTSRGVISGLDLLSTPESEILEGFSDQGVIQVRRITIKKDATIIPTKHLILAFNSPKLPHTIKAGYLNCKICPYIPNPLRCFKCQRFGHSQTSCRGQLTCSRCASVGHASTDCRLEQKCVNCSQPHSSDSKLCPKWKTEKEIQTIKTNRNISYLEARKLIPPQLSQTYAQVTKPSIATSTTQTDENFTKVNSTSSSTSQANLLPSASSKESTTQIKYRLPEPISSAAAPDNSLNTSASSLPTETRPLTTSNKFAALSTEIQPLVLQVNLLPSTSTAATVSEPQPPNPTSNNTPSITNTTSPANSSIQPPSASTKQNSKSRSRKRKKELFKKLDETKIEIKMAPHKPRKSAPVEYTTDEEDMIVYDVEEDEIEKKPADDFVLPEFFRKNPHEYVRALTPTRYRK
ncbi:uncharacterized protein TNCV_2490671 [Trichonephila clavipes]|nr:uncharacterized protein TNCV_2490671 [Trichonephila clavipes]